MFKNSLHIKPSKLVPEVKGHLRQRIVTIPRIIYRASGIKVLRTRFKSLIFSTDAVISEDHNVQTVMTVYPFTPQLSIVGAILNVSQVPVFVGVGEGVTSGQGTTSIVLHAGLHGTHGIVVSAPISNEAVRSLHDVLDIPIVATVVSGYDDIASRMENDAQILDVSGGGNTAELMEKIRGIIGPGFPIIVTDGDDGEQISTTIRTDVNIITYTPPITATLFREIMTEYR